MPSDTHRHDHAEDAQTSGGSCCGSAGTCGDIVPTTPAPAGGRSFQVSGLDCAEEVAILNKVVGPKIGGAEHLAFDVINGRMTILDSAKSVSDGEIAELVASTGMTAKPWDAENASVDQAAHLARQRLFTALSGGFWAAGFLWHIIETGMGGALGLFAGHGEAPMPLVEAGLFAVAILFGVWLVAPKAWSSARRLSPDMNLLMVVAVAGAIGLGEFFEAATVAFFFSLSLSSKAGASGVRGMRFQLCSTWRRRRQEFLMMTAQKRTFRLLRLLSTHVSSCAAETASHWMVRLSMGQGPLIRRQSPERVRWSQRNGATKSMPVRSTAKAH